MLDVGCAGRGGLRLGERGTRRATQPESLAGLVRHPPALSRSAPPILVSTLWLDRRSVRWSTLSESAYGICHSGDAQAVHGIFRAAAYERRTECLARTL
jgi:hypothetical protein